MTLTAELTVEERELLRMIAQSPNPVNVSDDSFYDMWPPDFDSDAPDDDPRRAAWAARKTKLDSALLVLIGTDLVTMVEGAPQASVVATEAGRAALA
ncbi:hypothetical protein ACF06X_33830 [Streptomyces sp. NPDC015346]|uniref:hypothetical protein n=1 Tax=Streptomyces sp. NPDC015346 TaxID=3364954 RepID=UPI0036F98312